MIIDGHECEEVNCPDCGKPYMASPMKNDRSTYEFIGCACRKQDSVTMPLGTMFGFRDGPVTFWVRRGSKLPEER
jgi:hypothetical protein